ncbi:hypothetical protein ACFQBQ_17920 [Granulicella cerasi]|uniref:Uncharacterized protein n=1 Tax=Granulicella cerasi TaxID=741063 RepID=A0ABW1ZEJ6_9BACT
MIEDVHKILQLLEGGFSDLHVLVVGDLMLDRYILGEVDRISPEALCRYCATRSGMSARAARRTLR